MVISSEFRMKQYRDEDHREGAPHFIPKAFSDFLDKSPRMTDFEVQGVIFKHNCHEKKNHKSLMG